LKDKPKILFRADGNLIMGLGHLYRLFALYEIFEKNYDCIFVTKEDSALNTIPKQFSLTIVPRDVKIIDEINWLIEKFGHNFIVIIDGYQFTSSYQMQIKEKGLKLIYIDDLAKEYMYADIVINHSPSTKQSDYESAEYTKFALGTNYAILRSIFLKAVKETRIINQIDTAFVCFGGSDINNLTLISVKALLFFENFKTINVVMGASNKNTEIFTLQSENPQIKIYRNLSEQGLASVMQESNFAIVPASTILYELCTIKMPILSGYYVDNQKSIYYGLLNKKAISGIGNFNSLKIDDLIRNIGVVLKNNNVSNQLINQRKLFDGKIKNRFLKLIETLWN